MEKNILANLQFSVGRIYKSKLARFFLVRCSLPCYWHGPLLIPTPLCTTATPHCSTGPCNVQGFIVLLEDILGDKPQKDLVPIKSKPTELKSSLCTIMRHTAPDVASRSPFLVLILCCSAWCCCREGELLLNLRGSNQQMFLIDMRVLWYCPHDHILW